MAKKFYRDNYYPARDRGQAIPFSRISFEVLANACLAQAERLVAQWLPEGRREGQEWVALNPRRADSHLGSFKVNLVTGYWADFATGDKGGDLISLYGYLYGLKNGQAATHLLETMGMATSQPATTAGRSPRRPTWTPVTPIPPDAPPAPVAHHKHGPPSAVWTYRDAAERVLFHIYRFDLPNGKQLLPLTYCRNPSGQRAWRWQGLEAPRPLYNLHLLAARPNDWVLIPEGEKATDAGGILFPDYVPTTSPGGSQAADKADWTPLSGRKCAIWADNDAAGRHYTATVARRLQAVGAACVRELSLEAGYLGRKPVIVDGKPAFEARAEPLPEGWDAADALADGWTVEHIQRLRADPGFWIPPPEESPAVKAGLRAPSPRVKAKRQAQRERETTATRSEPPVADEPSQGFAIECIPGKMPQVLRQAEQALITAQVDIYQRGGLLVRPLTLAAEVQTDHTHIPVGTLVIEPVTKHWLAATLTAIATWWKFDARQGALVRTDCPPKYAETYLDLKGHWQVPLLTGIVEAPLLRRDGSLLTRPGYDRVSGLYLVYTGSPVRVPETPSRQDALAALAVLHEPLEEFPFIDAVDRSVALSGLLTALQRRTLRTAPYHLMDAPVRGAGKGLLVDTIARIVTGRVAVTINLGADPAEDEKRLGALLIKGCSVISIDNIERHLQGDFLCSLATQEAVDHRLLGTSTTVTIPTHTATLFITGNNAMPAGDMTRRILTCRIDPHCERPDTLTFQRNLHEFIPANRHRLLSAALTVLRAYSCAGRPPHRKGPYGSFEQWDTVIRGALLWLDQPDPLDSRERIAANDPETTKLRCLLTAWFEVFKEQPVTTAQVIQAASPKSSDGSFAHSGGDNLRQALLEIAGKGDTINARSLGWYLTKKHDRVVSDYRLEQVGTYGHASQWRVRFGVSGVFGVSYSQRAETVSLKNMYQNDNSHRKAENNSKNSTNSKPEETQPVNDDEAHWENLLTADVPTNPEIYRSPSTSSSQARANQPNSITLNCQACRHYSALAYSCGDSGHYVENTADPRCGGRWFQSLSGAIDDEERI